MGDRPSALPWLYVLGSLAGNAFFGVQARKADWTLCYAAGMGRPWAIGIAWSLAVTMLGCGAQSVSGGTANHRPVRPLARHASSAKGDLEDTDGGRDQQPGTPQQTEHAEQTEQFEQLQRQFADAKPIRILVGKATYYSNSLSGRAMASGETYDPEGAQAAHRSLPFGSIVRVTQLKRGESVVVRIADRGPLAGKGRIIDLSYAAARRIGLLRAGVADVRVEVLRVPAARKSFGR
jgi:rare lipoprotein A